MYKLMIGAQVFEFDTYSDREGYIIDHWKEIADSDVLVPCSFGGWIDVRDA